MGGVSLRVELRFGEEDRVADDLRLRAGEDVGHPRVDIARPRPAPDVRDTGVVDGDHRHLGRRLSGGQPDAEVVGLAVQGLQQFAPGQHGQHQRDRRADETVAFPESGCLHASPRPPAAGSSPAPVFRIGPMPPVVRQSLLATRHGHSLGPRCMAVARGDRDPRPSGPCTRPHAHGHSFMRFPRPARKVHDSEWIVDDRATAHHAADRRSGAPCGGGCPPGADGGLRYRGKPRQQPRRRRRIHRRRICAPRRA